LTTVLSARQAARILITSCLAIVKTTEGRACDYKFHLVMGPLGYICGRLLKRFVDRLSVAPETSATASRNAASLAVLLLSTKVLLVALSIGQSIRLGAVLFLGVL
jgi:hypothetical protein